MTGRLVRRQQRLAAERAMTARNRFETLEADPASLSDNALMAAQYRLGKSVPWNQERATALLEEKRRRLALARDQKEEA